MEIKKQAGENAAQKLSRLLAKLNRELIEEGSADALEIKLDADGSATLLLRRESGTLTALYGCATLDAMSKYLESSTLMKLVFSVAWSSL